MLCNLSKHNTTYTIQIQTLRQSPGEDIVTIETSHADLGGFVLHCDGNPSLLFTENDTNNQRLFGTQNASPYVKDGINNYVVMGRREAFNPNQTGTKAQRTIRSTLVPAKPRSSGCG